MMTLKNPQSRVFLFDINFFNLLFLNESSSKYLIHDSRQSFTSIALINFHHLNWGTSGNFTVEDVGSVDQAVD
jgi:uncharacterized protein YydD (DUF2326 family)